MVGCHHTENLFKEYKGEKKLVWVEGDHCEERDKKFIDEMANHLMKYCSLKIIQKYEKNKVDEEISRFHSTEVLFTDFKENPNFDKDVEIPFNPAIDLKNKIINSAKAFHYRRNSYLDLNKSEVRSLEKRSSPQKRKETCFFIGNGNYDFAMPIKLNSNDKTQFKINETEEVKK